MSIFNRMKNNPGMTIGGIFFLVALVVLIGWLVNRGKGQSTSRPVITFETTDLILNPDNETKIENYKIEYASDNLGKNIDIKVKWKNGAGFEQSGVKKIILKRKVGNSYIKVSDESDPTQKTLDDPDFVKDFKGGSASILGKFIGSVNVVGDNNIELYYITNSNTTQVKLGTQTIRIEQNHLDTTIDLKSVSVISINPTQQGDILLELNLPEYTKFNIISKSIDRKVADSVRFEKLSNGSVKLKDEQGQIITLPGTAGNSTYIFEKYLDDTYLIRTTNETRYLTDNPKLHANSLVNQDKSWIFSTTSNLDTGLFYIVKAKLPTARYVRIQKGKDIPDPANRHINLMEVGVYDKDGNNVSLNKNVFLHGDPSYEAWKFNFIDGDYATLGHTGSNTDPATESESQHQGFDIDLGKKYEIKEILIADRPGYPDRLEGIQIRLFEDPDTPIDNFLTSMLKSSDANAGLYHVYSYEKGAWKHMNNIGAPYSTSKTVSRAYPPKPYPNTTAVTTVKNVYEWTVDSSAGYGEGKYKVEMSGSLLINREYDGSLDAEGLFDKGVGAPLSHVADEHSYHSPSGGGVAWFHFYLPKYITLDKLDIYPRGYSDVEMTDMQKSVWNIYGIDRSSGSAVQTTLYSSGSKGVTFTKGQIKSLIIPDNAKTKKYKEFKVDFDPAGTKYIVFNELLFYGSNESDSA
jgi:hypothetical protein